MSSNMRRYLNDAWAANGAIDTSAEPARTRPFHIWAEPGAIETSAAPGRMAVPNRIAELERENAYLKQQLDLALWSANNFRDALTAMHQARVDAAVAAAAAVAATAIPFQDDPPPAPPEPETPIAWRCRCGHRTWAHRPNCGICGDPRPPPPPAPKRRLPTSQAPGPDDLEF
jgi:hypothetical protein